MAKTEQPPESPYVLPRGQNDAVIFDEGTVTPCQNEEVSGKRLPNGKVIDLWFGESGGSKHKVEAYREAAALCWSICAIETPEAFERCAMYQAKFKPKYGVYGGVIPEGEDV